MAGLSRRLLELSLVDDAEVPLPHLAVSRHEDALLLGVHESLRDRFTLSMLEFIGDEVTRYYRERGLILAKVYIPKQQVRDGVVAIGEKAARIIRKAETDAEERKEHSLQSAQAEIGELVVSATEKLLSSTASPEKDSALYDEFIRLAEGSRGREGEE